MTYYAVIFDNDLELSGVQFVNVANNLDDENYDIPDENISKDYEYCQKLVNHMKNNFPNLNYRVVEIILKELEN